MECHYYNNLVKPCSVYDQPCNPQRNCARVKEINNPTWSIPDEPEQGQAPGYKQLQLLKMEGLKELK